jgi:ADP-ribose pyrophosphatase YjhB (NUDIX family)
MEPLRHFTTCPRCAAPVRAGDDGANPFRCVHCGFVLFFNAASAVAVFVERPDGRVLYTRRARDPGRGRLGMPGGFVDFGETAEDAARREVHEEVGLELGPLEYLASFPNRYEYAGVTYATLDLFFVAPALAAERARALDAVASLEWVHPSDVDSAAIAFDSMRRARLALLQRRETGPRATR